MDFSLEMVIIPTADVDRAKAFYADRLGWNVDVDHAPNEHFRVVQLTPPGSACSITIGKGLNPPAAPGSYGGLHLCVKDIAAAHELLVAQGVDVSDPYHFTEAGQTPGLHPGRGKFETFMSFADPDGNGWVVQEVNDNRPASKPGVS